MHPHPWRRSHAFGKDGGDHGRWWLVGWRKRGGNDGHTVLMYVILKKALLFIYFLVSYTINKCMYEYCLFTESVLWQEYENRKALNFIQDFSHEIMLNFFKQLFSMCCWNGHMFSVLTSTAMMLCIHWLGHVRATLYICDEIDFIMSMTFFWDDISLCSPV